MIYNIGSIKKPKYVILKDNRKNPRKPVNKLSFIKRHNLKVVNKPVNEESKADVYNIPLSQIHIKKEWFQNRKTEYSQESVNRIVNAVKNGLFNWAALDPVLLWKSPENKLYMLSGHSRNQAFKILSSNNVVSQGKNFNSIPAKIFEGTLDQARKIALESNVLSTRETDTERALYYKNLRKQGKTNRELLKLIQENEGKDANKIFYLSFLNKNGKAFDSLENLDRADQQSKSILQTVAVWLGLARSMFPLSDLHENEIFDYLVLHGGYGNKSGQIYNRNEFISRIDNLVKKNSFFGKLDPDKLLNIRSLISKDSFQLDYEKKLNEAEKNLISAKKLRDSKLKDLVNKKATTEQIRDIIKKYDDEVLFYQRKYQEVLKTHDNVINASKAQTALFGIKNYNKNPKIGTIA